MIGIVLITHLSLGESLLQCACHVMGRRPEQLMQLGLSGQDNPLALLPLAQSYVSLCDSGEGVLLLTDLPGASPANLCRMLHQPGSVEIISGVSLPMLVRALSYREQGFELLTERVLAAASDFSLRLT